MLGATRGRNGQIYLAPLFGVHGIFGAFPGVSLRSTPGYCLATLSGCLGEPVLRNEHAFSYIIQL